MHSHLSRSERYFYEINKINITPAIISAGITLIFIRLHIPFFFFNIPISITTIS